MSLGAPRRSGYGKAAVDATAREMLADVPPRVAAVETAVGRVDPGAPGAHGQSLRVRNGAPVFADEPIVNAGDEAIPASGTNALPALQSAFARANFNLGASGGAMKSGRAIDLPPSWMSLAEPLQLHNTWHGRIRGIPDKTALYPLGSLDSMIQMDGVGYTSIEGIKFRTDSQSHIVQDVIRADRSPAAIQSVHNLRLRDITIDGVHFVRGVSLGRNSATLDMAQTFVSGVAIPSGGWAAGNTTTRQEGIHVGSPQAGNVLNFVLEKLMISGVRYGVYVDNTNVSIRDAFFDGGEFALAGVGRFYVAMDGFRSESFTGFCRFAGVDMAKRQFAFRNGEYVYDLAGTPQGAIFERAGDILFENVVWGNGVYVPGDSTTHSRILTSAGGGSGVGRLITLRNFTARETPEELWWSTAGSGLAYRVTWMVLDGYTQVDASSNPVQQWRGGYHREITNATSVARRIIMPYDRFLTVTRTTDTTMDLPFAKWMQGRELVVTRSTPNTVTLTTQAGETVAGATSYALAADEVMRMVAVGTNWRRL